MIDRRGFMMASSLTGVMALGTAAGEAAETARDLYELRTYHLDTEDQQQGLVRFLGDAAIPALNRLGVSPVGVFETPDAVGPVYVLLRHASADSVITTPAKLLADSAYLEQGAAFLDAPAKNPAYARVESSLLLAFSGMPQLAMPAKGPGRVFQLRIYESPSVKTGQKKIEMFNTAELVIFKKTGLTAVFFGEAMVGSKMPNLTYMLGFESDEEQKAAWDRFLQDPDWRELSARPEYANDRILSGITNLPLRPAPCSQI